MAFPPNPHAAGRLHFHYTVLFILKKIWESEFFSSVIAQYKTSVNFESFDQKVTFKT